VYARRIQPQVRRIALTFIGEIASLGGLTEFIKEIASIKAGFKVE
jgi:hypothetical protein